MWKVRAVLIGLGISSLVIASGACRSGAALTSGSASYIVTSAPLDVGVITSKVCIAVDPSRRDGVWWWQPGAAGCATRSTGPSVFAAANASVSGSMANGDMTARFTIPVTGGAPADVVVRLASGTMTAAASAVTVPIQQRKNLDIPERPERAVRGS